MIMGIVLLKCEKTQIIETREGDNVMGISCIVTLSPRGVPLGRCFVFDAVSRACGTTLCESGHDTLAGAIDAQAQFLRDEYASSMWAPDV